MEHWVKIDFLTFSEGTKIKHWVKMGFVTFSGV